MFRVPVLYIEQAMREFEAAVEQAPVYDDEIVGGYVGALIYWNRPTTYQTLVELRDRGVIWMPKEAV